jgi:hypothetical protein
MAKGQRPAEMKLSQAAKKTISLAAKIHAYYETELPKWFPQYPIITSEEEGPPPPPEEKALRKFLLELPADLLYQLILIIYLGREEFGVDRLADTYAALKQSTAEPKWAVTEMVETASLADYLSDGLERLQAHGIDVDHLPLQGGAVAKS